MFSKSELQRYARHFVLPNFGKEAQLKLKNARVLVVGAGGLGSPVLLYLAAAGVGNIGIVDFDTVDDSNLQRQVLFTVQDVGLAKAETAKQRLLQLNPHLNIEVFPVALTADNALEIIKNYDIVADGTDNFPTRYLVNDACVILGKVNVYASIFRYEGQVAVFNYLKEDGTRSANYRDLFPQPPAPDTVPNCAEGGILGVLAGMIGTLQANEVIKVISGNGEPLVDQLYILDSASLLSRKLKIRKNSSIKITELIDYQAFCGLKTNEKENSNGVKEITTEEFKKWQRSEYQHRLLDVREEYEYEIDNLAGELVPSEQVADYEFDFNPTVKVVVHCKSGARSQRAIEVLKQRFPEVIFLNLTGGIDAYRKG
ncbi:MAG: ThiF family adenylyltransferase [Saprospiraceae bacterium]